MHRSWKHLAALLGALVGFSSLAVGSAGSAAAAEIADAITAVSVVEDAAAYGDRVRVDVTWALPDTVRAGDTFWLQLPDELARRNTTFDLRAPSGAVVATAVVATTGRVTFTVTDFVENHDQVSGSAYFSTTFVSQADGGEVLTLDFPTSGVVHTDQITVTGFDPIDRDHPVKAGFWTDPDDQGLATPAGALTWAVASPRGPADTVRFSDEADAGQAFDCGSVAVERTTTVDPFSGFLLDLVAVPAAEYTLTCTAQAWSVELDRPLADAEIVQVLVQADITDPTLSDYTNDATVTVGSTTGGTTATVSRFDAGGVGDGDGMGPLRVVKVVQDEENETARGPFTVRVDCTWDGAPAPDYPKTLTFDGAGSRLLTAPIASLCTVTETETGGADDVAVTPEAGVTVTKDVTGTVELVVTNTFRTAPSGSFSLTKEVAGPPGAVEVAPGTTFTVSYTVDGVVAPEPLTVTIGEPAFSPQFPVGAQIVLAERTPDPAALPENYVWTDAVFTVDGEETDALVIAADGEAAPAVAVTLTNHVATVLPPAVPEVPQEEPDQPRDAPGLPDTGSGPWTLPGLALALTLIAAGSVLLRVARPARTPSATPKDS